MHITNLRLTDFRNLKPVKLSPSSGSNVFMGLNAQGKTSLLEAIYFCAMGKSHRTSRDSDMVQYDQPYAMLRGVYRKGDTQHQTQIYLDKNQKKIKLDDKPITKLSNLIGKLCCVIFSPEDLRLSKGGPAERRRFMDRCMSQIYPNYFYHLSIYDKNLKMRNAELKHGGKNLDIWDINLAKAAIVLYQHRLAFVEELQKEVVSVHRNIIKDETITLEYQVPKELLHQNSYIAALQKSKERDLRYATTTIGPHRDDILIKLGERDVRQFGSQGQQRTAALSLKLAELQIMKDVLGDTPILLLDDVMSELDKTRQSHLIDMISGIQSFITTTHLDFAHHAKVYSISEGNIKEEDNGIS